MQTPDDGSIGSEKNPPIVVHLSIYSDSIKKLKNALYRSAEKDIKNYLEKFQDIDEAFEAGTTIRGNNTVRMKKGRSRNTRGKLGSRSGYRIYYMVDKKNNAICALEVYPKTGQSGRKTLTQEELINLFTTYLSEIDTLITEYKRKNSSPSSRA